MTREKIDRINFLARKARDTGLTEAEKEEQADLRSEYIGEIRVSFGKTLEHTVIKRPDGSIEPLKKKRD